MEWASGCPECEKVFLAEACLYRAGHLNRTFTTRSGTVSAMDSIAS
jgi:hypothetical protein